jgi:hypothetical protein
MRHPVTRVDLSAPPSPAVSFGVVEAQVREGVLVVTSGASSRILRFNRPSKGSAQGGTKSSSAARHLETVTARH